MSDEAVKGTVSAPRSGADIEKNDDAQDHPPLDPYAARQPVRPHPKPRYRARARDHQKHHPCARAAAVAVVNAGGHTGGHGGAPAPPPDGWPACYAGPKCTSDVLAADFPSGHGCYDCSMTLVSECPACAGQSAEECRSWQLVLTENVTTYCGAETVVDTRGRSSKPVGLSGPACYKGPGCADYPSAHGCYDCGIQTEAQCTDGGGQMFSEAIDITQCYQKTAPKKPWPAVSPPSPPPNPPSPPPPGG